MKSTPAPILAALIVTLGIVLLASFAPFVARSSAPSGVPATQRMATTTEVGPQETKTLFSATSICASRVIRTQGEAVFLLFADPVNGDLSSSTLSAVAGFHQGASTTVAYDSGIYGCGRVTAEATASTTITTAEFN